MQKILECVPNFSEGTDKNTINSLKKAILNVEGVKLLDIHLDPDHNRSVFTFLGEPSKVIEAAYQVTKTAANLINLHAHQGIHPRIGATDVIPLIPLKGITDKEAIALSEELSERIGSELNIPVFLYEKSAASPEKTNLAYIRKNHADLEPDFGPKASGTAGYSVVGVRDILIAFNINLDSSDLKLAKEIAAKVRETDGGLKNVKALGLHLHSRDIVQISMNLTDYKISPPLKVFKQIEKLAAAASVPVLQSELVGCAPLSALPSDPQKTLKLANFSESQILDF